MDQSKKTMRHFYCRDVLWDIFEQMANDFDCSIDYLINEAMRYYARSKNYTQNQGMAQPSAQLSSAGAYLPSSPLASMSPRGQASIPANSLGGSPGGQASRRPPPPPAASTGGPTFGPSYNARRNIAPQPSMPPSEMHPRRSPLGPGPRANVDQSLSVGSLFLIFNNQRIPIDKDQFIIGRGSKTSDLAIKDGNISRKHAAIIRRNGTYYIKDLGSTNGIDYKGMRIDNKRIDEGDVFHLCDYELRFTYRG